MTNTKNFFKELMVLLVCLLWTVGGYLVCQYITDYFKNPFNWIGTATIKEAKMFYQGAWIVYLVGLVICIFVQGVMHGRGKRA